MTMVKNDSGHKSGIPDRGRVSRRQRKKEVVRTRLFETALHLFASRGYEQTSVQEICERADVAKGTFFNYFPSKEHVLLAYHDQIKQELLDHLASANFDSAEDAVQDAFRHWARRVTWQRPLGRILIRVMFGSDLLLEADERQEERFLAWLEARIENARRTGELRKSLDVELFLSLLIGVLSSTTLEWMASSRAFGLEDALQARCAFLFESARGPHRGTKGEEQG